MKKIYSIIIVSIIILILSASAVNASDNYENVKDKVILDCVKNNYLFYDSEQEVINVIQDETPWDYKDGVVIMYPSNSLEILDEFSPNNLPYGNSYSKFFFETQIEGQIQNIDGYNFAKIVVKKQAKEEHYSGLTEKQAQEAEIKANQIADNCKKTNEVDSIKAVYNYLCDNIEYDYSKVKGSIYEALITGNSVCSGYAGAFQLIMEKMGIPCYLVSGNIDGVAHVWNAVLIDNVFYYVDATYGDTTRLRAKYLLFGKDVRPDLFNLGISDVSYNKTNYSTVENESSNALTELQPVITTKPIETAIEPVTELTTENAATTVPETNILRESMSEEMIAEGNNGEETVSVVDLSEAKGEEQTKLKKLDIKVVIVVAVLILLSVVGGLIAMFAFKNKN